MADYGDEFRKIIEDENGYLRISEVERRGIDRIYAYNWLKTTDLKKVGKGIFVTPETKVDWLYVAALRNKCIIYSHETALCLWEIIERDYIMRCVTIPQGHNARNLKAHGIEVIQAVPAYYNIGKTKIITPYGHIVPVYDRERTMCDIIKRRKYIEDGILSEALKKYFSDKEHQDLEKLESYAEQLDEKEPVGKYIQEYLTQSRTGAE